MATAGDMWALLTSCFIFEHYLPAKKAYTIRADPDQTASEEAVWSGSSLFAILISFLRITALISCISFENRQRKVFKILEHFP